MSDELRRTLDAQRRRVDEIDAMADDLLAGDDVEVPEPPSGAAVGERSFADVVVVNDILRAERGWEQLLPPPPGGRARREWSRADLAVVGLAGIIGFAASWFDSPVESWLRDRLKMFAHTDLVKGWERDAKKLAIDYTGPGFGGPGHRVRSAGHDLMRPVSALRQIMQGEFRGIEWVDHVKEPVVVSHGKRVDSVATALVLWLKHLGSDFVTDRSLPVPGWTYLYELPFRDMRRVAHRLYEPDAATGSPGFTMRTLAAQNLPMISTEVLVRGHLHGRALHERGSLLLDEKETVLCHEMLLAAHGITGAASLGKTLTVAMTTPGPMWIRHLNVPVLVKTASLGVQVARSKTEKLPDWEGLLDHLEAPWDLELAQEIEAAVAAAS